MLKALLLTILTTSILTANVCEETRVHSGSIRDMDTKIEKCEKLVKVLVETGRRSEDNRTVLVSTPDFILENILVVSRLVNVYPNTENTKRRIINSILKYSDKYDIDPVTLTALLAKESSMRSNIDHSVVFVKVPTKRNWTSHKTAKVRAVGMGGVIFEIWKYELEDIGIKNRSSLKNIETNIKASAYILSVYTHERKQLKHTVTREESALLRYYGVLRDKRGVPNKTYSIQVYKIKNSIEG